MLKKISISVLITLICAFSTMAEPSYFKDVKKVYDAIDRDLLSSSAQTTEVSNFVYTKDVATFTFTEGTFYLLRFFDERPTTALFIGNGHASIHIPNKVEQQTLMACSPDSLVEEDFEFCLIRMADDFDLKLKEAYSFETTELGWKHYNHYKQNQGEYYFKPLTYHKYDYYYQLLLSIYERSADGFFWIDFNRYVFNYDPNRPEQVIVGYEYEGGDEIISEAAIFQKMSSGKFNNEDLSDIPFESVIIKKSGELEMAGIDGSQLKQASITMQLAILADSLRFLSTFLDHHMNLKSVTIGEEEIGVLRRGDFDFTGLMLPEYLYQGDTVNLTFNYSGSEYASLFPSVDNPAASIHDFNFIYPKGYNYFLPGILAGEKIKGNRIKARVAPDEKYRDFFIRGYVTGLDTVQNVSEIGLSLNFLKWKLMNKKYSNCFIPEDIYVSDMLESFNFMASRLGAPPGTFGIYLSPAGDRSMPGLMEAPQISCVTEGAMGAYGGFKILAGRAAARQWFGSLLQPATDRELWLTDALPEYLSMMYLENSLGGTFYNDLAHRRDSLSIQDNKFKSSPLAAGLRAGAATRSNKGIWVIHMLRIMMRDMSAHSDQTFYKFIRELILYYNNRPFTNADFIARAEKHYGQSLASFADQWIYGHKMPEFDVIYSITEENNSNYVDVTVESTDIIDNFEMPVVVSVYFKEGEPTYTHQMLTRGKNDFKLGPFEKTIDKLVFNEFFSVLSEDHIDKK